MKNILFFFLFCATAINAQTTEVNRQMSLGLHNGISVTMPIVEAKFIEKVWKRYTKDFGKVEKNKKASEIYILNAKINSIRTEGLDLYASIADNEILAFFDVKNGFLNSTEYPKEFEAASRFMTEFGYEVQREKIREELETETDNLKKYIRNLEKLKKDNINYHRNIEEAKAKIKKAEDNITSNEKEQIKSNAEIANQTTNVNNIQAKLNAVGKSELNK
ncbi:MAG: hypothetical protein ABI851_09565 [Saprospiraceae bacterium]